MMDGFLSNGLPTNINGARLPATYEAAKVALQECAKVDEAKEWSDKAAAIASYARQSDDKTLENMAARIRARAIRRTGELLQEFQSVGGRPKTNEATLKSSQEQIGKEAGLSEWQIANASASIPATKAAWIATCPYFPEETPISGPPMALSGFLGAKRSPERAKSVPTGHKF